MRRALTALAMLSLIAACSKHDTASVSKDAQDAGHSAKAAISKVADNPDVKKVESEVKAMGHDAAKEFRKTAGEAKTAAHDLASDAHRSVHGAASGDDKDKSDKDKKDSSS
jgi:hypothetical protein